jgi:Fic family protein
VEITRVERRVQETAALYDLEAQGQQIALNVRQIKLLDYLRQSKAGIGNHEYQSLFHVSKRTASNDLAELVAHGLLTVEGAGPATRYWLSPPSS